MHQQFVNAVNQLGIDSTSTLHARVYIHGGSYSEAVPKRILDLMDVEGLTRENVASHLQKYRLYLKRVQGINKASEKPTGKSKPPDPGASAPPAPVMSPPTMGMMGAQVCMLVKSITRT